MFDNNNFWGKRVSWGGKNESNGGERDDMHSIPAFEQYNYGCCLMQLINCNTDFFFLNNQGGKSFSFFMLLFPMLKSHYQIWFFSQTGIPGC